MTVADRALEKLQPWMTPDLRVFILALASMWDEVEPYFTDQDEIGDLGWAKAGWETMLDVDNAPPAALPYLAQWIGERLPQGLSVVEMRQWIRDQPNRKRGTMWSIARAAQRWLTGTRTVLLRESSRLDLTNDPDGVAMITYAAETPNEQQVRNEMAKVIPADIMLYYQVSTGENWANVHTAYASWNAVHLDKATWGDVHAIPPAFTGFTPWYR